MLFDSKAPRIAYTIYILSSCDKNARALRVKGDLQNDGLHVFFLQTLRCDKSKHQTIAHSAIAGNVEMKNATIHTQTVCVHIVGSVYSIYLFTCNYDAMHVFHAAGLRFQYYDDSMMFVLQLLATSTELRI